MSISVWLIVSFITFVLSSVCVFHSYKKGTTEKVTLGDALLLLSGSIAPALQFIVLFIAIIYILFTITPDVVILKKKE